MNTGKMSVKEQRAFLIEERNITMINNAAYAASQTPVKKIHFKKNILRN